MRLDARERVALNLSFPHDPLGKSKIVGTSVAG